MRTAAVEAILARAAAMASGWGQAGPGVEHVLLAIIEDAQGREILDAAGADVEALRRELGPLVRFLVVRVRPELAPWLEAIEHVSTGRGSSMLTTGELLAEIMAATDSAGVVLAIKHGARRVDVLNVIAHGIAKVTHSSTLPRARLVRALRGGNSSGPYRVIMHNDVFTTYAVAIDVLVSRFGKTQSDAAEIAKRVHAEGRAIVGVYSLRAAAKRVDTATAAAHDAGFPLRFSFEPDDPEAAPGRSVPQR